MSIHPKKGPNINILICGKAGLCVGESLGAFEGVDDKSTCVETCQETDGCEFYTFDASSDPFCFVYSTCPVVDDSCASCTSGEDECPRVICRAPGECATGFLLDEFDSRGDPAACGEACLGSAPCRWYTHFEDSGKCVLYETCHIDGDGGDLCDDCLTSERTCAGGRASPPDCAHEISHIYAPRK